MTTPTDAELEAFLRGEADIASLESSNGVGGSGGQDASGAAGLLPPQEFGGVGENGGGEFWMIGKESRMASYTYRLPWPPSVNTYWRRGGKVTYLTEEAREFRAEVCECVAVPLQLKERLAVHIELVSPTRRKYDIDNRVKATLDALMHAGVFIDDEQIDELRVKRLHVEKPGACDVTITELGVDRARPGGHHGRC